MGNKTHDMKITDFYQFDPDSEIILPLYSTKVSAGFPSPADDFVEQKLDLNQHLIKNPAATFLVKVEGESMIDASIHPGDILVVDRSVDAIDGKIVIAILDGDFTVKRFKKTEESLFLNPENAEFSPIEITDDMDFEVWGVVTNIIKST